MSNNEKILKINNVEICAESFGNAEDPPILLIMGASASMIWWDEVFCQRLADRDRFVIRYDNRDVGRSTCYEPGNPEYTVEDLADDALGLLDAYNINKAHIAGMSLGGMIAQLLAMRNPDRVLTIIPIMSGIWDDRPELPTIDQKILDYHAGAANLDWENREEVIKYLAEGWGLLSGSKHGYEKERAYKLAKTEVGRARNLLSMFNHALLKGGESYYGKVYEIKVPTLIINGDEDPVLPPPHSQAIAEEIPGAKLLTLKGVGHELHYEEWDPIIDAMIKHTEIH